MLLPGDVRPALIRTTATFLQGAIIFSAFSHPEIRNAFLGTWFWFIGFILYPKIGGPWDQDDHTQMLIVTMMFTWNVMAAVSIAFIIGLLVFWRTKKLNGGRSLPGSDPKNNQKSNAKVSKNGKIEYRRLSKDENIAMNMFSDTSDDERV